MNLLAIKQKVQNKIPVTTDEYLFLLANDKLSFWGFLISNNPGSINNSLRNKLGYTELGFYPDQKAISRIIEIMIQKGEKSELTQVLNDFTPKTNGLSQDFIQKFTNLFSK